MKNRLEELRKQRGIKQEDLASALEVSRQTIGSLENGRYNPSIILAFKIARYFQMSIEEIFIYEEESEDEKKGSDLVYRLYCFVVFDCDNFGYRFSQNGRSWTCYFIQCRFWRFSCSNFAR